jgi:DNA-binding response OmpR family regulator
VPSILIVEDDEDLRLELSDYLSARGYTVQGVGTLAAAEQTLQKEFALVLLDIYLPDGCGLEFCQRMRPYVRAGIVMMTGRSERALRIQGLKGGADAYLVKPVDPEELEATLHSVLRHAGGHPFSLVPTAPLPVQWRLDRVRRTLTGPKGHVIVLGKAEAHVLATLLQAPAQQLTRDDLLRALDAAGEPGGASISGSGSTGSSVSSGRRIETLLSRLRGKVDETMGLELPLRCVYGEGYAFLDHARVI